MKAAGSNVDNENLGTTNEALPVSTPPCGVCELCGEDAPEVNTEGTTASKEQIRIELRKIEKRISYLASAMPLQWIERQVRGLYRSVIFQHQFSVTSESYRVKIMKVPRTGKM